MANASLVAGVHTGSVSSCASDQASFDVADAATWRRARPAFSAAAGKRTSRRSWAGTVRRRPWPCERVRFEARTATATSSGASVWFCTTTGSSNVSPKLRKRGADGRTISGRRAVMVDSRAPNELVPAAATAITRQRVSESGSFSSTLALPLASVFTRGDQCASALRSLRMAIGGGASPPPPPPAAAPRARCGPPGAMAGAGGAPSISRLAVFSSSSAAGGGCSACRRSCARCRWSDAPGPRGE